MRVQVYSKEWKKKVGNPVNLDDFLAVHDITEYLKYDYSSVLTNRFNKWLESIGISYDIEHLDFGELNKQGEAMDLLYGLFLEDEYKKIDEYYRAKGFRLDHNVIEFLAFMENWKDLIK